MKKRWILLLGVLLVTTAAYFLWRSPRDPGKTAVVPSAVPSAKPSRLPVQKRQEIPDEPVIESDPEVEGDLTLLGSVIDSVGKPVPGAAVTISTNPRRSVRTAADGSFSITELPGGSYRLVAQADGLSAGPVTTVLAEGSEPVVLVLTEGASLDVVVVSSRDGAPIEGAHVALRGITTIEETTDGAGEALLRGAPPETYTVVSSADGFAPDIRKVLLTSGNPLRVRIPLESGRPVSGRVVDVRHQPVSGARVHYERDAVPSFERADNRVVSTTTEEDGTFRFAAVGVGSYRFKAEHPDHAPGSSSTVTIDGRRPVANVEITLSEPARISGKVVSQADAPVEYAKVTVGIVGSKVVRGTTTLADGTFVMTGLPRSTVEIVASGDSGSSRTTSVDLAAKPQRDDIVLTLDVTGGISGIVVDSAGRLAVGAQVTAVPNFVRSEHEGTWLRAIPSNVTDREGRFQFVGLKEGVYTLHAAPRSSPRASEWWTQAGKDVSVGTSNVKLVLAGPGAIEGKVVYEDGGSPSDFLVSVSLGPPSAFTSSAQDPGHFTVSDLDPGTLDIVVSGPTFKQAVVPGVEVKEGKTTSLGTIKVKRGRGVSGRVLTKDGKPVSGATVYAGNNIVANGSSISSESWNPSTPTQTYTTNDAGEYTVTGMGNRAFALVADHPDLGRSAIVQVPARVDSTTIDLTLQQTGALKGRVTRGGKPVAGMNVMASPTLVQESVSSVTTDDDGTFVFERLPPDEYHLSAVKGVMPLAGIGSSTVDVAVKEGETASADIELPASTVDIQISGVLSDGTIGALTEIHVFSEPLSTSKAKEVRDWVAVHKGGFTSFNIAILHRPANVRGIPPGDYTTCAISFPAKIADAGTSAVFEYLDDYGDGMAAVCMPIRVLDAPDQKFSVSVVEPSAPEKDGSPSSPDPSPQGTATGP